MPDKEIGRRDFMKGVSVIGAASATALASAPEAAAQAQAPSLPEGAPPPSAATPPAGYIYLKPAEAEFVEALVDHMVPMDELTPSGSDIGIATYIDRALAGSWGNGARMYKQGPWGPGTPNQGYQLPLTPAELYRAAIAGSNAFCRRRFGRDFAKCEPAQKESFLKDLQGGKITLEGGLPGRVFFGVLYANVMEGLFADPIYGGNRDKIGWKMIGFPGVIASNSEHVKQFSDGQRFPANPVSIVDLS